MAPVAPQQPDDSSKKVKLLCSYGGRFLPRAGDSALRYVGGHTRIVSVARDVTFPDFMRKMTDAHSGVPTVVKYQLPGHDLDSLITVLCYEDLLNMMEEHDKVADASSPQESKLRLFLFSPTDHTIPSLESSTTTRDSTVPEVAESTPLAVVPAGMIVAPFAQAYAAEPPKEVITVQNPAQVQYISPQLGVGGPPMGLVAVASPQPQYVPVVPFTTAPAAAAPQEPQYMPVMPVTTAAPLPPSQPLVAVQTTSEATPFVERRLVQFPGDPSYAVAVPPPSGQAATVGVRLSPPAQGLQQGQLMRVEECAMCGKGLPHANSESLLLQEHGAASQGSGSGEKVAFLSLQPETTMWSHGLPRTAPVTAAPALDVGGYAQLSTTQNMAPSIDGSGYLQTSNVQNVQRGFVDLGSGASRLVERIDQSGCMSSPVASMLPTDFSSSEVAFRYSAQAAAIGDALQLQEARRMSPHQYPVAQQFTASNQDIVYNMSIAEQPEASLNVNMPGKGVTTVHKNRPPVPCADEQWKGGKPAAKVYQENLSSSDLMGEEEIILGKGFSERSAEPVGQFSRLEDEQLHDVQSVESRQLPSLLGDFRAYPSPLDVEAPSRAGYQLAQTQTYGANAEKIGESRDGSSLFSDPDPWRMMQNTEKLPPMPMKVAGQSLIPKHLLTENHKNNGGNTLQSPSPEEEKQENKGQLPGFLNKDSDSDNIQFMTGEKFKQDLQAVDEEIASTLHLHDISTMVNRLQLGAQLEGGIGQLQIIRNRDLEVLTELGTGTFGTVYYGKWRGSDVAIKRINDRCFVGKPSEQERQRSDFWNEACKLAELHHPNVLTFYGVVLDGPGGSVATVTEYMANGSLRIALHQKDKRVLDQRKRLLIAMDAAFGMEYLHKKNIVHFDLKSDNLLVNLRDPQRPICKVGDLGLSKVKHKTLISGGVRGTLPWMAPELLNGSSSLVSEKVDVYSFGIVMWELLTGEEPYEDMHYGAIIGGILNDTLRPTVPESCDPEWRSLMESCWASEPSQRPNFTEIAARLRVMAASSPQKVPPQAESTSPTMSRK